MNVDVTYIAASSKERISSNSQQNKKKTKKSVPQKTAVESKNVNPSLPTSVVTDVEEEFEVESICAHQWVYIIVHVLYVYTYMYL